MIPATRTVASPATAAITPASPEAAKYAGPAWYAPSLWPRRVLLAAAVFLLLAGPNLIDDPTRTRQWAEYLCYAVIAVGLDIAWGYGGMLALGQGVFFGLGAYAMGMHLSLEQVESNQLPEFMRLYSDYESLPLLWQPFNDLWLTVVLGLVIPVAVASVVGWLVFHRRIRGPYFAILTQASALVFWLLVVGQLKLTAGTNGLTNFQTVFGRSRYGEGTPTFLYYLAAGLLVLTVIIARQIVNSRFGKLLVATRDGEDRVRFLGYDPAKTKTIAFAVGAGMAGAAGMLAAPIIGLVAPNQFTVLPSILMVGWVAVGGRGTIYGAAIGALLVSLVRTRVSESRPEDWQYFQGLLFVVVVAFAPGGLAGLARLVFGRWTGFFRKPKMSETAGELKGAAR
ncbi:MAG: urea transport system permease protein [Candidatus Poriferisodalaceae bacterium]|jgi:urea transport system permease protein